MFKAMSKLEQRLYFSLGEKDQRVFTIKDIANILEISLPHARKIASKMVKKDVAERIKSGLFVRIPESVILDKRHYKEDAVLIAAKAFDRAFLSHYTSLSILGLSDRYTTRVYVTTLKHHQDIVYHDITIKFIKTIPRRFFGIKTIEYSNDEIMISDQERTILDVVNRPEYSGGLSEAIRCLQNLKDVNWDILLKYIKEFGNKALGRRIGYILDNLDNIQMPNKINRNIKNFSGKNIYYFDPGQKGIFEREWNMVIPREIAEVLHA
jgi:predicted transcriptional regulator of viral defense system